MRNNYLIKKGTEILKLKKGMTIIQVEAILGKPFEIVKCANPLNKKLIYKIKNDYVTLRSYAILFNEDLIVYVAKLNQKT